MCQPSAALGDALISGVVINDVLVSIQQLSCRYANLHTRASEVHRMDQP